MNDAKFHTVLHVSDYPDLVAHLKDRGVVTNGNLIAIHHMFEKQDKIRGMLELAATALRTAANTARSMDEVRDGEGDIDGLLRLFIQETAGKMEWLSNCSTIQSDMKEFYEFDKMELQ